MNKQLPYLVSNIVEVCHARSGGVGDVGCAGWPFAADMQPAWLGFLNLVTQVFATCCFNAQARVCEHINLPTRHPLAATIASEHSHNNNTHTLPPGAAQLLDVEPEEGEEEQGGHIDLDSQRKGKCAVIKTSTRHTVFLPVIGLVDHEKLEPGDIVVRAAVRFRSRHLPFPAPIPWIRAGNSIGGLQH